jgi:hypothetical protein
MSAYLPIAAGQQTSRDVSNVPTTDVLVVPLRLKLWSPSRKAFSHAYALFNLVADTPIKPKDGCVRRHDLKVDFDATQNREALFRLMDKRFSNALASPRFENRNSRNPATVSVITGHYRPNDSIRLKRDQQEVGLRLYLFGDRYSGEVPWVVVWECFSPKSVNLTEVAVSISNN